MYYILMTKANIEAQNECIIHMKKNNFIHIININDEKCWNCHGFKCRNGNCNLHGKYYYEDGSNIEEKYKLGVVNNNIFEVAYCSACGYGCEGSRKCFACNDKIFKKIHGCDNYENYYYVDLYYDQSSDVYICENCYKGL